MLVANNLHLPLMQVVAWSGMLVSYSRANTVTEAVEMTFDGDHPCPMCKNIKKAQTSSAEQDQLSGLQDQKTRDISGPPATAAASLPPPAVRQPYTVTRHPTPLALSDPPLTPPPIRA